MSVVPMDLYWIWRESGEGMEGAAVLCLSLSQKPGWVALNWIESGLGVWRVFSGCGPWGVWTGEGTWGLWKG